MIVTITGAIPSKSNSYQIGKTATGNPCFIKTTKVRDFEKSMAWQLTQFENPRHTGLVSVKIVFSYQSILCDIDGGLKSFLDTLQKQHWIANDRDVMHLDVYKRIDKKNPRIEFHLEEYEEQK